MIGYTSLGEIAREAVCKLIVILKERRFYRGDVALSVSFVTASEAWRAQHGQVSAP